MFDEDEETAAEELVQHVTPVDEAAFDPNFDDTLS